ncbi:MAG: peptide chain release factor 2 [Clostridiales bacterium]|nr:peptide chain release factor 2 [Clostridiales bacterium]
MIVLDDEKSKIKALKAKFEGCCEAFDTDKMEERLRELTALQEDPELFKDLKRAQGINAEAKAVSDRLDDLKQKRASLRDAEEYVELIEAEDDEGLYAELTELLSVLEAEIEKLHLVTLLKGEYDANNAILTLHAGAGGTEAQDWTQMLYRMYRMYAEKSGFSVEVMDVLDGDEAGLKSVTFAVKGLNAYGYLKAEKGVHRLVRISPFDSNARRHTSFASLEVMPEIENDVAIKVTPDELRIDTYRSGGAGGQHVNKTDSAVRITHIPTGIVVACQNERSQIQNKETAMKMLYSKLAELRERQISEKAAEIKGELKKIEWGSQIRSYVFQPYTMVKDHRSGYEDTDVFSVMDGNIQEFIFEYLRKA